MIAEFIAQNSTDFFGDRLMLRKLMAIAAVSLSTAVAAVAQDGGSGSTVQGDILRGQGQFLKGAAWYEIEAAKARAIDAQTEKAVEEWNRQLWNDFMQEREARIQSRKRLTKAQEEAARKKQEETEARLRTKPTADDLVKGDALNALLTDLTDPAIPTSSWRLAQVPLPPGLSIPSLVFRFSPKVGSKGAQSLGRGVIALARLDTLKGNPWPIVLSGPSLDRERKAYETAYLKVRDECLAGSLSLGSPIALQNAIKSLRLKASKDVPAENNYRVEALRSVDDLSSAADIFHAETIDYASEMIADTQKHEAKTVGELLAFMRKYRLRFATAERSPSGGEVFRQLYGLMREQKEKLGGDKVTNLAGGPALAPGNRELKQLAQDTLNWVDGLSKTRPGFYAARGMIATKEPFLAALNRTQDLANEILRDVGLDQARAVRTMIDALTDLRQRSHDSYQEIIATQPNLSPEFRAESKRDIFAGQDGPKLKYKGIDVLEREALELGRR